MLTDGVAGHGWLELSADWTPSTGVEAQLELGYRLFDNLGLYAEGRWTPGGGVAVGMGGRLNF